MALAREGNGTTYVGRYDALVRQWMNTYRRIGHADETRVHTLHYDATCCHTEGVCEWTVCHDVMLVGLAAASGNVLGLYAGSDIEVDVPDEEASPPAHCA